jgi:shikimate kinase
MTSVNRPIVILGFMGAGKTTVGRELARRLGCSFVDLDEQIVQRESKSIADIIREAGEPAFRALESQTLAELLGARQAGVIALGGGTWSTAANRRAIIASDAVSLWLDAPFELCWQRICESAVERPLAPNESATRILFAERRSDYEQGQVHLEVEVGHSVEETVTAILERIGPGVVANG